MSVTRERFDLFGEGVSLGLPILISRGGEYLSWDARLFDLLLKVEKALSIEKVMLLEEANEESSLRTAHGLGYRI